MQITVVGIKFKDTGKIYYFDPKGLELNVDDGVLVETSRGLEYGIVGAKAKEVDETTIIPPLKPVVRIATKKDTEQHKQNLKKAQDAQQVVLQLIDQLKLDMQVVDVEYAFDGSKVVISFTSDNRVDFRELVKELATKLKTRIELRQIGIRDKAKVVGGIGICGRECCCKRYLNDFEKVSIKMAKTQGLSLNPTKISGLCGRLMCCLEYENPYYTEVAQVMPKINSTINTPDGKGTVAYQNYLKQTISVKIESSEGVYTYKDYTLKDLGLVKDKTTEQQPTKDDNKQKQEPVKNVDKHRPKPQDKNITANKSTDNKANAEDKKLNESGEKKFHKFKHKHKNKKFNKDNESKN